MDHWETRPSLFAIQERPLSAPKRFVASKGSIKRPLSACLILSCLSLSACGLGGETGPTPYEERMGGDKILGDMGGSLFGDGGDSESADGGPSGIGVNAFLWRASLDTINFMPLANADPFGGVIITDWYQPPESPTERFKINIFILGRQLRADGIRAAVFRQRLHPSGSWIDAPVSQETGTELENSILTRARELRMAQN